MTQVKDIMTKKVVTLSKKKGLHSLIELMAKSQISCVVITENKKVVGVVTERDLIRKILLPKKDIKKMVIGDLMSKEVISVGPEESLQETSHLMKHYGIRHLPIIENGSLLGIVTQSNIVKGTTDIEQKNAHFMTHQNIQTFIIAILLLLLLVVKFGLLK